tara:strand:- start:99 stop:725 length:627 start_codon:yes stop_codon:yes gene_type:complete
MACLESAIFSIDLDDDNNMYQEGGGKMETQAVAIQKKLLEIAVNSVKKMKTQMNEAGAKQKKLLEIAVNSVEILKTQMDKANEKRKQNKNIEERERENERAKKEHAKKEKKLSGLFKTAVKMKEESDMELLKSLSQKVAEIFTGRLYPDSNNDRGKKDKEKEKYTEKCQSHFEEKYKMLKKLNYSNLYTYLKSEELNNLLSKVDNPIG